MKFADVRTNVLYILEDELNIENQEKLCKIEEEDTAVFIIVQMKISTKEFQPLINNLMDIRKEKALKKMKELLKNCKNFSPDLTIFLLDEEPSFYKFREVLNGVDAIRLYTLNPINEKLKKIILKRFNAPEIKVLI